MLGSGDLIILQFFFLSFHVSPTSLMLLFKFDLFGFSIFLIFFYFLGLFLNSDEPELCDPLWDAILALDLTSLTRWQFTRVFCEEWSHWLFFSIGEATCPVSSTYRTLCPLTLSDRFEYNLATLIDLLSKNEVGGRASITLSLPEKVWFNYEGLELGATDRAPAPATERIGWSVVHVILWREITLIAVHHALDALLWHGNCRILLAKMVPMINADHIAVIVLNPTITIPAL